MCELAGHREPFCVEVRGSVFAQGTVSVSPRVVVVVVVEETGGGGNGETERPSDRETDGRTVGGGRWAEEQEQSYSGRRFDGFPWWKW